MAENMPNDDRFMDQQVDQLHDLLADALRQTRSEPFSSPVTVAEIYQDLVPYRNVRSRLGFEMNADYEHTLLRLLAGEGRHARLEPKEARDELQAELATPNPNVGLFRKFAACDVWIAQPSSVIRTEPVVNAAPNPGGVRDEAPPVLAKPPAPSQEPAKTEEVNAVDSQIWSDSEPVDLTWEETAETPELLLEEEVDETDIVDEMLYEMPMEPSAVEEQAVTTTPPVQEHAVANTPEPVNGRAAAHHASGHCAFCDSGLPTGRAVKFCPYCGMDQALLPCGSCTEPMEADWRFCIACGSRASAVPVSAPAG